MSIRGLHSLVGRGVISDNFRAGILNGKRAELLHDPALDLDAEDIAAVMAIRAASFRDFASAVEQIVLSRESGPDMSRPHELAPSGAGMRMGGTWLDSR